MTDNFQQQLIKIIQHEPWLMALLRQVRSLYLPDWFIAGGAIRNTVWNILHGFTSNSNLTDIDVVYFDSLDLDGTREKSSLAFLQKANSLVQWDVVNQARTHIINPEMSQVYSSTESIAYWSETATCVGVRLEADDSLTFTAPHGLDDLFHLIIRPVPLPYQRPELYAKRIQEKQWKTTWQKLQILKLS